MRYRKGLAVLGYWLGCRQSRCSQLRHRTPTPGGLELPLSKSPKRRHEPRTLEDLPCLICGPLVPAHIAMRAIPGLSQPGDLMERNFLSPR